MGIGWPYSGWVFSQLITDRGSKKAPLPKICHTYPTVMKLGTVISYLKKIQKCFNHVTHPLSFADSIFSPEISKFCYIKKYRYGLRFHTNFLILLTFFESLKIFLIQMVTIMMMPAEMATLGLLKIMVFWNKDYDVIISVQTSPTKFYYVTQIIL